ncbi:hypothetical protein A3G98_01030 [Candidatus Nomurabacteria bacterium RIFCSPLOWO2_12_FULL_37_8]|uniref:DZANK-type domain-containing protein n=1 Tax=Candidatus Nomurabacteria bacterium RIFCSPLOWO2_12_FULL_37_8 TaxID=1801793 RepID=A0A1F6Y6U3_9BACT|nr:MAG: hypothetical protein A3G98_01030 [Candidatus Nomurabacteria bacterium RIFCSPLOWO2_12_FULL_37_8]
MYCKKCGNKLLGKEKFCGKCGNGVAIQLNPEVQEPENHFSETNQNLCEVCGQPGELKYVVFYENRGAIVMRYHREIRGNLCKSCIDKYFWKFTLITLCIGWLGVISFIVAPFYILNNVFRYIGTKIK